MAAPVIGLQSEFFICDPDHMTGVLSGPPQCFMCRHPTILDIEA